MRVESCFRPEKTRDTFRWAQNVESINQKIRISDQYFRISD